MKGKDNKSIIDGRIVKLNNRDEILKKSSLPMPIPTSLSNYRLKNRRREFDQRNGMKLNVKLENQQTGSRKQH